MLIPYLTVPVWSRMGAATQPSPGHVLLAVQGIAEPADVRDLGAQPLERGDRVLGPGRQAGPGHEAFQLVVGAAAQHDLADAGGVHRDREPDAGGHHVRLVGVGTDQVDDLVTVDDAEVDRAVQSSPRGRRRTAARSPRCRCAAARVPARDRIFGPGR